MTVARVSPPLPVSDLDGAIAVLRARGLRISAARRLVLEALFAAGRPVAAEEIASGLESRLPCSDLASVYRNLETLEQLGLVRHVHLGHGPGRYAIADGADHEHLTCERCGAHVAVPSAALDAARREIHAATGYRARFAHFPIVGLCPACAGR